MASELVKRIAAQFAGRQDKTLRYLQLAIAHGFVPAPERWYGKSDPGFLPLLPPGMHELAPEDLRRIAVAEFRDSTTRERLWRALQRLRHDVGALDVVGELWVGGSFVTSKTDPADMDVVLVLLIERVVALMPKEALRLDAALTEAKTAQLEVAIIFEADIALKAYLQGFLGFAENRTTGRGLAVLRAGLANGGGAPGDVQKLSRRTT